MCGAAPIPAGSGKTDGRVRFNLGGDRQANHAPPWRRARRLRVVSRARLLEPGAAVSEPRVVGSDIMAVGVICGRQAFGVNN